MKSGSSDFSGKWSCSVWICCTLKRPTAGEPTKNDSSQEMSLQPQLLIFFAFISPVIVIHQETLLSSLSICQSATLIQTEIPRQLLDGLSGRFLQILTIPGGWIPLTLVIQTLPSASPWGWPPWFRQKPTLTVQIFTFPMGQTLRTKHEFTRLTFSVLSEISQQPPLSIFVVL